MKYQQPCGTCLDESIALLFLPCGHLVACTNGAHARKRCSIYRREFIKGTVKAIM